MMAQMTGVRERKRIGGSGTTPHITGISLAGVMCRPQSLADLGKIIEHLRLCQLVPLPFLRILD